MSARHLRRGAAVLTAAVAVAIPVAGCGGSAVGAVGDLGLHALQNTKFGRDHKTLIQDGYCGIHLWRLEADVRHHSYTFAALQAYESAHHCSKVVKP